ncbi:MAG: carboxypeptidase regulatory-like domain-containing protein, partial [Desulfobacterales bacterium]|nr:carboxypeptidase regulatory-like domain-containing protein [Desulfobacterales bacterium]
PDGGAVPSWIRLMSPESQGTLAVGERKEIRVLFSPTESVSEGYHHYYLRVSSSNHPTRDINMFASVTQSGVGGVLFKVSDIYTGTLDNDNNPIPGLAGARIRLQNELVLTEEYNKTTDSLGEAEFSDLSAGRYKYRIRAGSHESNSGRLWIKPGLTTGQEVFLDYNLVTVEWDVTETTIEDKYEIVLTATYQTDVPAAVVIIEPVSVTLPDMKPGDVFNGESVLTNHGLVRADELV